MMPMSPTDDELLSEMRRVRSDLGFRKWIGTRIRIVVALIVFDLVISALSVAAVGIALNAQHSACVRDDNLRAAYTEQWQPILDQAKRANDPRQADVVRRFELGLAGFRQHGCSTVNYLALGALVMAGVLLLTVALLVARWIVVRRRLRKGTSHGH